MLSGMGRLGLNENGDDGRRRERKGAEKGDGRGVWDKGSLGGGEGMW